MQLAPLRFVARPAVAFTVLHQDERSSSPPPPDRLDHHSSRCGMCFYATAGRCAVRGRAVWVRSRRMAVRRCDRPKLRSSTARCRTGAAVVFEGASYAIAAHDRQRGIGRFDATHGWRFPLDQKHRGKFFGLRHEYPSVLLTKGKRQPKRAVLLHLVEATHCAW